MLALAADDGADHGEQFLAIVGEILHHLNRAAGVLHDGDQIGPCHLRSDESLRRIESAQLLGLRHSAHVEIDRQQPPVFVAQIAGRFGPDLVLRYRGGNAQRLFFE